MNAKYYEKNFKGSSILQGSIGTPYADLSLQLVPVLDPSNK